MRKLLSIVAPIFFSLPLSAAAQQTEVTARIVSAADTFLSSLEASQRQRVLYVFNDNEQRVRWSNFPTGLCLAAESTSSR
ncbi:MAG TPA: DUF3500 domain-containing protein [Bryobacteraceae bacterium]|nr:DUF3500 domain-containing protein [Bryobacteraceae bacterium]